MQKIALILAGGRGKRLFPLTLEKPKFLLKINGITLLESTIERIPLKKENIFIVGEEKFKKYLNEILKKTKIPLSNLILEPLSKNTLPAILLSLLELKKKFSQDTVISILPSDHFVKGKRIFEKQLLSAYRFSEKFDSIILFGLRPKKFDKNFGYIQVRDNLKISLKIVKRFIEKPKRKLNLSSLFLNLGIFTGKIKVFLSEIKSHQKDFFEKFLECYKNGQLKKIYEKIPSLQIDKSVLEKSKNLLLIPAKFSWNDVGNFLYLDRFFKKDFKQNYFEGKVFTFKTTHTTLISDSKEEFFLLGLKDIFIVKYKDKILISKKDKLPELREFLKTYYEKGN